MARRRAEHFNLGMIDRFRLGWRLLRDPRVSTWPKMLAPIITVLYVLSPIDAIPDFIPILGQLDDVGVIALALAAVAMLARWSPPEIVAQHAATLGIDVDTGSPPYSSGTGQRRERRGGGKDEPIEATYWVDDWR